MGVLARRLEATRHAGDWLTADDGPDYAPPTPSGVTVTRSSALGLTTIWRCIDLITHAVSLAPTEVVVKVRGQTFPEYAKPAWLTTPDPTQPNYTAGDYFGDLTASMLVEGNFFVDVFPHIFDPLVLTPLDPARVKVKPGNLYDILDEHGRVVAEDRTSSTILHGWWLRLPGMLRGISPLEALRRGISSAIAAEEFAGRFFGQGAALSFGVEVPGTLTTEQKEDLKKDLRAKYQGLRNSHAIAVLGGGAKFVSDLAPTPEQAQMLDTRKFSVEDLCRPYGIPPGMAGSQQPGASSYASRYVDRAMFRDDAVLKFSSKLERQHARLLQVPENIKEPGATVSMRFNLDWIARTDLLERYQAHKEGVTGGFITPNEARALEDLPPATGGDQLYMQQQMVPIGTQPQPEAA
jgi:HK97 family phage portal protein